MASHELTSNKIQEASVSPTYLGYEGMQYPLPSAKVSEGQITSHTYRMFGTSLAIDDWTKRRIPWLGYKNENEEFLPLPIEKKTHDDDNYYQLLSSQVMQTGWVNKIRPVNVVPVRSVDLGQLRLRQLFHRLRGAEAYKIADRIEYLVSEENAEDGGDIPGVASIASFVKFYLDSPDLGDPYLGTTPNGELQAMWELSEQRRLVAEFLDDDIVKYVYRRAGNMDSSKLFIMGRQPRHKIRGILESVSV